MTFRIEDLTPAEMSRAERLASLTPEQRASIQNRMTQSQRDALKWEWDFWARPDQIVPDDCSVYIRSAGRGSGKTREGAEWARKKGPRHREGLLIGANPRDARDLMLEGRSGIVSVTPPWERPVYEPTKLLLRWPNGAIAHVRSAEDPAGIRGLSVEWIWCFPAGTKVTTNLGQLPIEQVRAGDRVLTRKGFKTVEKALSRRATAIATLTHSAGVLRATPEHPIWTNRGWVPIGELVPGDTIATCPTSSTGTVSGGTNTGRIATSAIDAGSCTTAPSTRASTARLLPASTSTTATRTGRTTTPATSRPSPLPTTSLITRSEDLVPPAPRLVAAGLLDRGSALGSEASPAPSARNRPLCGRTAPIPTPSSALTSADLSPRSTSFGVPAALLSCLPSATALLPAEVGRLEADAWLTEPASSAGPPSSTGDRETLRPRLVPARVESVSVTSADEQVWDLKVEGAHEFIADGVVAHNCDEIVKWRFLQATWDQSRLALREGTHPQTVVTTTPMPLPLIKKLLKGGRGILVRPPVSTYRNFANLSPDYLRELLEMYEGTRLGDQELHAMVLEDVKGAIWTHEEIEGARWGGEFIETPTGLWVPALSLRRKVVGVDPSGSTFGDEWGIVVVGTDGKRPPTGFVMDDRSKRGSPEEGAREAVHTYWEHNCEAMVGEVNYGAEMVERLIRAVPAEGGFPSGETVRFEAVRAGRGQSKYERAVPVHGLFEQNLRGFRRFYMVGNFKELENQMTTWIPPEQADGIEVFKSNWSPDRMDAMVWASLYLLVLNPRVQGRAETKHLHSANIG